MEILGTAPKVACEITREFSDSVVRKLINFFPPALKKKIDSSGIVNFDFGELINLLHAFLSNGSEKFN